ncbi:MAG: VIT and VWA domain-containing protein [Gammaproteobacteria bacterium]|nr:VIT and VWA domain-containing protein [Gammaproteobacteria bacterium]
MKYLKRFKSTTHMLLLTGVLTLLLAGQSHAAGLMTPKNSNLPALDIRTHDVNVIIEDGYAITTVEQTFHNPHAQDLEALYSFPVPDHAAVAEFTVWIDGKPVVGEVLEKERARKVYQEEKQAGRDAGLTEKNDYKTFEISVAPVRSQQDTRVRLTYFQPAHIDTGVGRYVYPLEEGGVDEAQTRFWTSNEKVKEQFSFNLIVKSAYPVTAVRTPNQSQAAISQATNGAWNVAIHQQQNTAAANEGQPNPSTPTSSTPAYTLDNDIVVYWRLAENLPGSVDLVAHKPEAGSKGTFMLTVTPGDDLANIQSGSDWVFVLDTSGSMQGKYATLANGVEQALGKMRPEDRFRIVTFNDYAQELTSVYVNATPENVKYWAQQVASVQPGNSTNLYDGLSKALKRIDADRTTGIVLVTDGVANVGVTEQKKFIELIEHKDIRLFTFIMGNSANEPLLTALTKASGGFALSVSNADDIVGKILLATSKMTHKALHGVKVTINGVKTSDLTPETIGSLYRGQQLVVFGHYWGDGLADVKVSGKISGQDKVYQTQFNFPATATGNPEVERLWAYAKIEDLQDEMQDFGERDDTKQAITDIATEYSLVTDYTSMVVMREESFAARGIERNNAQRVKTEQAAQQQRAQQPAQNHRADTQQPMFNHSRPGLSGGAVDFWMLLLLPAVLLLRKNEAV